MPLIGDHYFKGIHSGGKEREGGRQRELQNLRKR